VEWLAGHVLYRNGAAVGPPDIFRRCNQLQALATFRVQVDGTTR